MSPQNSTLGLMGGVFKSTFNRAGQRSGIYRPEDNAYIRNYVDRIDNFFYTGNTLTWSDSSNDPITLSSFFIRPNDDLGNTQIISCSGFDTDGQTSVNNDSSALFSNTINRAASTGIEGLSSTTKKPTAWQTGGSGGITWYPEPLGLSFSPDGTQLIVCGNLVSIPFAGTPVDRGPIIYQYTLSNPWDITSIEGSSTWSYGGTDYGSVTINPTFYSNPPSKIAYFERPPANIAPASSIKIQDVFVDPVNGGNLSFLYDNYIYQRRLSVPWDIGVNGANIGPFSGPGWLIAGEYVSSSAFTGSFSGFSFNKTGTKLYVTSRLYGGTILQFNTGLPFETRLGPLFETFLYLGNFEAGVGGSTFNPDGTGSATVTSPSINFVGKRSVMLDGENMYHLTVDNVTTCQLHKFKILPY